MEKYYKNSDYVIYWNLSQSQKAKLIVELNKKLKNWLNECVQQTMTKWGMRVEGVEIEVEKETPFFKYSNIEKANGSLEIGVTVYYNNGDYEFFHRHIYWNGRTFI